MQDKKVLWNNIKTKLNDSPVMLSVIANAILFIIIQIFFEPRFETNDDNYMAAILYGSAGEYSSRIVFINVIIGKILKILMQIILGVCWYTVFQYTVMFLSFVIIFYIVFSVLGIKKGLLINGILGVFFVYEAYAYIQFSKTAGIAVSAGMFLIFFALSKEKDYIRQAVIGAILILVGSMIRFSVFEMLLVVFFGVGLCQCIRAFVQKKYRKIGRYVGWFVCIFLVCFGCRYFDSWAYASVGEWQEYKTFNTKRANVLDYGFPDYSENYELYEELGIEQEDLEMYRNWDFADPEKFNESAIDQMIRAKEKSEVNVDLSYIAEFLQTVIKGFIKYQYFAGVAIILLLWCLSERKGKFLVLYEIMAVFGIAAYCFYRGRYLINRVDYNFFLAVSVIFALLIGKESIKRLDNRILILLLGAIIFTNKYEWINNHVTSITKEEQIEKREFFDLTDSDKEHLYLVSEYTQDDIWVKAFPVYAVVPKGITSNHYVLGGWGYKMPQGNAVLEKYQILNPFREIVDNPDVYLVDNLNVEQKVDYIRRHYNEDAYASWAKYINGVSVFRVVTQEPELNTADAVYNDPEVKYEFNIREEGTDGLVLEGYIYKENTDSYKQMVYIGLRDKETGEENYYYTCQLENNMCSDVMEGKFSAFERYFDKFDPEKYEINLYLENESGIYATEIK